MCRVGRKAAVHDRSGCVRLTPAVQVSVSFHLPSHAYPLGRCRPPRCGVRFISSDSNFSRRCRSTVSIHCFLNGQASGWGKLETYAGFRSDSTINSSSLEVGISGSTWYNQQPTYANVYVFSETEYAASSAAQTGNTKRNRILRLKIQRGFRSRSFS